VTWPNDSACGLLEEVPRFKGIEADFNLTSMVDRWLRSTQQYSFRPSTNVSALAAVKNVLALRLIDWKCNLCQDCIFR
jgi:hypothetical protein